VVRGVVDPDLVVAEVEHQPALCATLVSQRGEGESGSLARWESWDEGAGADQRFCSSL
jgi:hypothetical protein